MMFASNWISLSSFPRTAMVGLLSRLLIHRTSVPLSKLPILSQLMSTAQLPHSHCQNNTWGRSSLQSAFWVFLLCMNNVIKPNLHLIQVDIDLIQIKNLKCRREHQARCRFYCEKVVPWLGTFRILVKRVSAACIISLSQLVTPAHLLLHHLGSSLRQTLCITCNCSCRGLQVGTATSV